MKKILILIFIGLVLAFTLMHIAAEKLTQEHLCTKTKIASGFRWAENLWVLKNESIIVTDAMSGSIVLLNKTGPQHWNKVNISIGEYQKSLGVVTSEDEQHIYVLVQTKSSIN